MYLVNPVTKTSAQYRSYNLEVLCTVTVTNATQLVYLTVFSTTFQYQVMFLSSSAKIFAKAYEDLPENQPTKCFNTLTMRAH